MAASAVFVGCGVPPEGKFHAPFLTAAIVLAVFLVARDAPAQGPCDQRDSVLSLLAKRYKEMPVAVGVTSEGSLVEVLTDAKGTSWTIIVTSPQGTSCLILSGEGWRRLEQSAREPEA